MYDLNNGFRTTGFTVSIDRIYGFRIHEMTAFFRRKTIKLRDDETKEFKKAIKEAVPISPKGLLLSGQ